MLTIKDEKDRVKILEKKRKLFDELLEMTFKQKQLIEENEWSKLSNTTHSKQLKIDKIDRLDELYEKLRKASPKNEIKSPEETPLIETLFKEINRIAKKMDEIEKNNIKELSLKMEDLGKELNGIRVKRKVNTAYSKIEGIQKDGCFIDKHK